jgi:hypothetical protein
MDQHLRRALDDLEAATQGLSPAEWQRCPAGHWHCAEIVEHLARTYGSTAYILDKCVRDGAPKGARPSWRQRLGASIVVSLGYLPSGVKAPAVTVPTGITGDEALALARRSLQDLDVAAQRCTDMFGPDARVANHPILGGFTISQWRRFHWVHTHHHVRQILRRRG